MKKIYDLFAILPTNTRLAQNNHVSYTPSSTRIFICVFSIAIAFFCCIGTTAAQGIYLEIPTSLSGLPTSTTTTTEVTLNSVQFGVSAAIQTNGNPTPPSFSEITVTKSVDISSIALQRSIATATTPIAVLKINFYRTGHVLAYQYVLEECFFSSYSASSSEGCTNGCAGISESLSIHYRKISVIDSSQQGTPRRFGYNITTGQEF